MAICQPDRPIQADFSALCGVRMTDAGKALIAVIAEVSGEWWVVSGE